MEQPRRSMKTVVEIFSCGVLVFLAVFYSVRHFTGVSICPELIVFLDSPVPNMNWGQLIFIVWITALAS